MQKSAFAIALLLILATTPPDYLLFLKKDADGSFSPVSGHTFPGEGVFSLRQPL